MQPRPCSGHDIGRSRRVGVEGGPCMNPNRSTRLSDAPSGALPQVSTPPVRLTRIDVQNVGIDPLDVAGLLDRVGELLRVGGRSTVTYANVHVVNLAAHDPTLRGF